VVPSLVGMVAAAAGTMAAGAIAFRVDGVVEGQLRPILVHPPHGFDSTRLFRAAGRLGEWPPLRRRVMAGRRPRRLVESGIKITPGQLAGLKVIGAVAGAATLLLIPSPIRMGSPFAAVIGFLVPDVVIHRAVHRRRASIDASLGDFIDLLAAATAAGLAASLALRRAAAALEGPLGAELRGMVRAVDHGARWQTELLSLAERLDLRDLRRVAAAMRRTKRLGASLSGAIRELATDVRDARRTRATERARTAPVKMLFPLVFLILPAFLLLTVVPVLLSTLGTLR
jgi:Flp pilus assembly protein TadB